MQLRELEVRNAKPKDKLYKLSDGDGLYLAVHPNGSKYWQTRCRYMRKEKVISHGKYPIVGIAEARKRSGRRETAKKLRGPLSAIFRLAVVTLRAEADPTEAIKGALLPPKVKHRAAIPFIPAGTIHLKRNF